ncbi:ABC transporter ATP-binding protein [uncultured Desulfuromusa sp.]|uniref:ABC transporter ATP-binding protein n=1 Tax=uncultured Desulfuromusa sp. TaxID=219183 RepID=UPI002AA89EF4|nr:ABC transporter ATP-binding protein [uncultured Desulfuromusa sp.]
MIELKSIFKTYRPGLFKKKVQAVNDLSLTINQGDVFGLIGPNGAGKSTTIRMLMGLIRPDEGTILFSGQLLEGSFIRSKIGYLPENPYLYDHLTLLELLHFCGKTSGLSSEQVKLRGQELMAKLNLLEAQKRPLRTFSKGMLQRAGICFALLHDPSIVVLDEPMSGLDPIGRKMVFDLVMELKGQGKTIFFCSHILNDVERLCDRIGLIHQGCLIKEFDRQDFLLNSGQTVFLKTNILHQAQQAQLKSLGVTIRTEGDDQLLAIPEGRYYEINSYLEQARIDITGCRSEWMTLEDMFMKTVEEQS